MLPQTRFILIPLNPQRPSAGNLYSCIIRKREIFQLKHQEFQCVYLGEVFSNKEKDSTYGFSLEIVNGRLVNGKEVSELTGLSNYAY